MVVAKFNSSFTMTEKERQFKSKIVIMQAHQERLEAAKSEDLSPSLIICAKHRLGF